MNPGQPKPEYFLDNSIEFLKGVGSARGEVLKKELEIFTFGDLLQHYPFRYVDRTKIYTIREVNDQMPYIQLKGKISSVTAVGIKKATRLIAQFRDETGMIELVWFRGIKWMRESLKAGVEYIVFGKPTLFQNKINIVHPEMEIVSEVSENINKSLQPFYNTTEISKVKGIDSRAILKLQRNLAERISFGEIKETLPEYLINELKMVSLKDALTAIHFPHDVNELRKAQFRLKFEELFYIQMKLLKLKLLRTERSRGKIFSKVGDHFNYFFYNRLPFQLTNAQKKVLKEIRIDMGSGKQMNRLLQGDVGSGKTLVALMSMLLSIDNGYQACIMAPTEILAKQHFETIKKFSGDMKINVELLTGSTKNKDRKRILENLQSSSIDILIGTHAVIEDDVQFNNLGLVVIDEQHRFGVEQRARLWTKDDFYPHVLVMTATPIPRTLAMTLYGDLDVSVIDELPPGRKHIKTVHYFESKRLLLFGFIKDQIKLERQVYIVYPLIEESEKMDYNNLMEGFESITREFPLPQFKVSIVHGRMKTKDKEYEMKNFVEGKTNVMVATTVIEVGVDVPNASVMVIESAERFGLSQLHQLRGRVGRGAEQSFCILMTGHKLSQEARLRLETMVRTNDGFEIAETDLKLRGPGEMSGTQQSGIVGLKIADLAKDSQILVLARKSAIRLLENDPHLVLSQHANVFSKISSMEKNKTNWSRVS
ncbi:MAG: ATP-dependent DNA helicase RecG [Bacteroidia bacterium]